jgi:uncharacterized membrane protein YdjX (TVP38/TMEM64 family)
VSRISDKAFVIVWVLALGLAAGLVFYAIIGAWNPGDTPVLTVALAAVILALVAFGAVQRRGRNEAPDAKVDRSVVSQRERRGF